MGEGAVMNKETIEGQLQQYVDEHQKCVVEAQELTQRVNNLTIRASKLEGAAEALQVILEGFGEE